MSNLISQDQGMKTINIECQMPVRVVAKLGPVRLVQTLDGRHVLVGGTFHDQIRVREWCLEHAPFVQFEDQPDSGVLAFAE